MIPTIKQIRDALKKGPHDRLHQYADYCTCSNCVTQYAANQYLKHLESQKKKKDEEVSPMIKQMAWNAWARKNGF